MSDIETVELETGSKPVGSVIWLHGLGADGHDFEPIVPELKLPGSLPLRFVFPHAPVRPVTINGGVPMRAWYDIVSLDSEGRADEPGILASTALLDAVVEREISRGLGADSIVVAGFSQGGAIALHHALTSAHRYAGIIALSTYLALPDRIERQRRENPALGDTSVGVFQAHGTFDPMVPYQAGRRTAGRLAALGYTVDWHEYPMAHGVCPQEIDDLSRWLVRAYDGD